MMLEIMQQKTGDCYESMMAMMGIGRRTAQMLVEGNRESM